MSLNQSDHQIVAALVTALDPGPEVIEERVRYDDGSVVHLDLRHCDLSWLSGGLWQLISLR